MVDVRFSEVRASLSIAGGNIRMFTGNVILGRSIGTQGLEEFFSSLNNTLLDDGIGGSAVEENIFSLEIGNRINTLSSSLVLGFGYKVVHIDSEGESHAVSESGTHVSFSAIGRTTSNNSTRLNGSTKSNLELSSHESTSAQTGN